MATALVFSTEEALLAALTSDLLPADVQSQPARYWRADDGSIGIFPSAKITRPVSRKLRAAGVVTVRSAKGHALRDARTWAQVVRPQPSAPDAHDGQIVLFATHGHNGQPGNQTVGSLLDLAGELLRLGCDRAAYQMLELDGDEVAFIRAFEPPYYTVAACGERHAPYRAFIPAPSGQTRTWIELGYDHPLVGAFEPPAGRINLITGAGEWHDVPDGPWRDIFEFVDITLPTGARDYYPIEPPRRLTVALSLAPATRTEPPSLWVLGDSATGTPAIDRVDALVRALPDDVIARLLFAVLEAPRRPEPVVVLRARLGRLGPPPIDIEGTAMVPLMGIANLYVPHDAIVEPPLRRDMLRELMAAKDDTLYWLEPTGQREFRIESAPDRAFSPLADWVEYLVHASADELTPWVRSVSFEFEAFQSIHGEWATQERPEEDDPDERRKRRGRKRPERGTGDAAADVNEGDDVPIVVVSDDEEVINVADQTAVLRPASEVEVALAALERQFLDSGAAADDPARSDMWLDMARLLNRLDRRKDRSLCYVRVLWEATADDARGVIDEWVRAEARAVRIRTASQLLWLPVRDNRAPDNDVVRAVATAWIATVMSNLAVPEPTGPGGAPVQRGHAMQTVQAWFDRFDESLDVRTMWLLRHALAEHAGGDPLSLARTRDRILQNLHRGLSLERDVPTFLRFLGGDGFGDSVAAAELVASLQRLREVYDKAQRKPSATEPPRELTDAYVALVFAYGFARLGRSERAHELRQAAEATLTKVAEKHRLNAASAERTPPDPRVHEFLLHAYSARIAQALEGLPHETPLPSEIAGRLGELGLFHQYQVNRLRERSQILTPQERVVSLRAFLNKQTDSRGEEFAALRGMTSGPELTRAVLDIVTQANRDDTSSDERERLYDGVMDFFTMLPDSRALPALQSIIEGAQTLPPNSRVLILEEALMLAGYFGRDGLANDLAESIGQIVGQFDASQAAELAPAFDRCLRSMRRVGLRDHAAQLIETLTGKVDGDDLNSITARVHLAGGLAHLGDFERAQPILRRAEQTLSGMEFHLEGALTLTQALAASWSQAPQEHALHGLVGLGRELPRVTDNFSTNSYFCLSVIIFMEALVLGYARGDLALGELGRRWLDEDEYLVRRRIHRDLGERS